MKKRILSITLALAMVLSIVPMTAFSQLSDVADESGEIRAELLDDLVDDEIDSPNQSEEVNAPVDNLVDDVSDELSEEQAEELDHLAEDEIDPLDQNKEINAPTDNLVADVSDKKRAEWLEYLAENMIDPINQGGEVNTSRYNSLTVDMSPPDLSFNRQVGPLTSSIQAFSTSSSVKRYTVLVLDRSGSMYGTAMNAMKQSAIRFCYDVLKADGENYVAVVAYDTNASIISDFTSSFTTLERLINNIYPLSMTNTNAGLEVADELLSAIPSDTGVIKNILLLSDGMPNAGAYSSSGRYTYSDYYDYGYANATYNTATTLKEKEYYIYTLGFFHGLWNQELSFARRFMKDLQNAGYYDVTDPNDLEFIFGEIAEDIINPVGTFKYAGHIEQNQDSSAIYNYDDAYFLRDSHEYDPQLATMSLCFELSSWSSYDVDQWPHKSKNARELLTGEVLQSDGTYVNKKGGIGYKDFAQNSAWNQAPKVNSIGLVAANKTIVDKNNSDKEYTLIAVAVRGGGYFSEWGGNFNVGSTGFHTGFDLAKEQTLTFINNYIKDHNISGDIKLWIVGFSRAGATANMVAGAINSGYSFPNVSLNNRDIFCYTFEAPQGVLRGQANKADHSNIHNVVNLNDPVPMVAFSAWDFQRYNAIKDYILPSVATANFYGTKGKLNNMLKQFEALGFSRELYQIIETTRTLEIKANPTKILPGGDPFIEVNIINDKGMTNNQMLQGLMKSFATTAMVNRRNYASTFQMELVNFMDSTMAQGNESLMDELLNEILDGLDKDNKKEFKHIIAPLKKLNPFYSVSNRLRDVKIRLSNYVSTAAAKKGLTLTPGFLNSLVDALAALINQDDGILLLKMIDNVSQEANVIQPHWPEITLAWLMSQDTKYTSGAVYGSSQRVIRVIYINCPVDISVYDESNDLVTSIIGDQPSDGLVYSAINENGEKMLLLPADEDYTIDIKATGTGSMTLTISEYDMVTGSVNRLINYYDLPIESGNTFIGYIPSFNQFELENGISNGSEVDYSLIDENGNTIYSSEEILGDSINNNYFTVSLETNNYSGTVYGGGEFLKGTFAKIQAQPVPGGRLLGWYIDDNLVSTEEIYRFAVRENVKIVAKFENVDAHDVKILTTSGGTVTGAAGFYVPGTELEMIAEANPNYRFKNWETSNGGAFTQINNATTTFTMPANDTTIRAIFEYISNIGDSSSNTKEEIDDYRPANPNYSFSGGNSEYIIGSEIPLVLTIQKDFSLFRDVRVNSKILMRDTQYKAESRPTVVMLLTEFLNTLSVGQHSLEVRFFDGVTVNANFTIAVGEDETYTPIQESWLNPFIDVREGDWFYEAVKYSHQKGLITGTSPSTFSPHVRLTRGMMATILWNYAGKPQTGNTVFTDVANNTWYTDAINWAAINGIVSGYGNSLFGPNDEITREQMAVMLYNYTKFIEVDLPQKRIGIFVDDAQISTWAKESVDFMYAADIINGKGNNDFDPQGRATRAEVAVMMRNFMEIIIH